MSALRRRARIVFQMVIGFVIVSKARAQVLVENQPQGTGRGGRMIAITLNRANAAIAIAASPSGGLFKTVDGGATWAHLDGLPANRLWDVQIDPSNGNQVLATIVVDSHKPTYAGLWRSVDGGATWTQPAGTSAGYCDGTVIPDYGREIFFGPGANVFVATDCGLAVSRDGGATWSRTSVGTGRPSVWSVAARPGIAAGSVIVDICTAAGPRRSTDGGATFGAAPTTPPFPIGICTITESPTEQNVLFATSKDYGTGMLWESDDAGATWTQLWSYHNPGRYPWVRTTIPANAPAGRFDLYFHAGADVFRQRCTTGATLHRCAVVADPATGAPFEFVNGGHDVGGIAFDATGCPAYLGSDYGVTRSTDCGVTWDWKNTTLTALSIYDMAGTVLPTHTDLYFGTQDNYIWGSQDNGVTWPWGRPSEGLWLQAPHKADTHGVMVTGTVCTPCYQKAWGDHGVGETGWPPPGDQNPPGGGPPFVVPGGVGPAPYLQLNAGSFWMRDIAGTWRMLTPAVADLATTQFWVSGPPENPTAYVVTNVANVLRLQRVTGFGASASGALTVTPTASTLDRPYYWAPDDNPAAFPYVVGVDPSNGARLIAPDATSNGMLGSGDSGKTWRVDTMLTRLVTASGKLLFNSAYLGLQAHVIRFNPSNGWHVLVGTEAAGIIETCDAGQSWHVLPGSERATAVSDFVFDEARRQVHVATYGRGLWRIDYPQIPVRYLALRPGPGPLTRRPHAPIKVRRIPDPCWEPQLPSVTIPAPPRVSIRVAVRPAGDPALVLLGLDGSSIAPPVGDGFWSGWRTVSAGTHVVTAIVVAASGGIYKLTLGGDCSPSGGVVAASGLAKTCLVTATRQ